MLPILNRSFTTYSGKPRVAIIGAGWGGFRVARDLDKNKFDVTVVSPRCDHPPLDDGYHDHCCAAQEPLPLHPVAPLHDGGHP